MGLNAWRCVDNFTAEHIRECLDGNIATCTYIDHLAFPHIRTVDSEHICLYNIRYVREIPRHGTVAKYCNRFIILASHCKLPYRERIRSIGVEPGPVHVEVPQADCLDAVCFGPQFREELTDILLQTIRIDRIRNHRLDKRKSRLFSICRAGCRIDKTAHFGACCSGECGDRSCDILVCRFYGVLKRVWYPRHSCGMEYHIGSSHNGLYRVGRTYIDDMKYRFFREGVLPEGRVNINDVCLPPRIHKRCGQIASDEPSATRNDGFLHISHSTVIFIYPRAELPRSRERSQRCVS